MNAIEIEHQLYLLSNEISDYNKKIKDCKEEIKDNEDMKKDALVSVKELFDLFEKGNPEFNEIESKYIYLFNI